MVSIYYVMLRDRDAGDAKPLRAHAHYTKGTKSSALVYNISFCCYSHLRSAEGYLPVSSLMVGASFRYVVGRPLVVY